MAHINNADKVLKWLGLFYWKESVIIGELFDSLKFRSHKLNSVEKVTASVYPYMPSFLLTICVADISGCVGHFKQRWLWSIQMCQLT